jgi:tetratricopeptide (TPR) repeat protein
VVTSRSTLSGLVAVEGAHPFTLDVFTDNGARDFLVERLGAARVAADIGAVQDIAAQCARLPLALAVVASRAAIHPHFPLATLSTELSAARDELGAIAGDDLSDVRTAFSWSYERLEPNSAGLFRLLGLHPGPDLAASAAASLVGVPGGRVRTHLAELARAHLIIEHVPGRYAVHDLLRAYAGELAQHLDTEEIRRLAIRRMLDYYLRSAYAAATLMYPHRYRLELVRTESGIDAVEETVELADADHALVWFTKEHAVLMAAVDLAAEQGFGVHCWQLASALATYLVRRGHWHDWAATQRTAIAAAERIGDQVGLAHAHGSLGMALNRLKRYEAAHAHLTRAYDLLSELGDVIGQAQTLDRLSSLYEAQGEHATALSHAERARDLYHAAGYRIGYAQALNSIGWHHTNLGRYAEAVASCEQAIALHRELGDRQGVAHTLDSLGFAYHHLGRYREAVAYFREALQMLREAGDNYYETITLTHLGDTLHADGHSAAASDAWRQALKILGELGHPDVAQVHARLTRLDGM